MSDATLGSCYRAEDGWIFLVFSEWNTGRPLNILGCGVSCFLTAGRERFKGKMTFSAHSFKVFSPLGQVESKDSREPGIRATHTLLGQVLPDPFSSQSLHPHCYASQQCRQMINPLRDYALNVSGPSLSSHLSMHEPTRWEISLLQMILWGDTAEPNHRNPPRAASQVHSGKLSGPKCQKMTRRIGFYNA